MSKAKASYQLGNKGGKAVRTLASQQCGPGSNLVVNAICLFIYLFYFICHTNYKKYRKRRRRKKKKKWRGDLTETIGAYERLGPLEL